jgi:hypothetical protein
MEENKMIIYRREANQIRAVAQTLPNKLNGTNVTLGRKGSKYVFRIKKCLEDAARLLDKIE